ncbi:tetratricopeptide repeat protein [Colwelliaceae bacterium 6471]
MKGLNTDHAGSWWSINLDNFVTQLKQRQVFKVATIYAVSAWPLIQIADLAIPAIGLPDSAMTLLLQIFIAGFPICLIFAWLFNFTEQGIVRTNNRTELNSVEPHANIQATIAVVGSLLLVFLVTLGTQLLLDKSPSTSTTIPVETVITQDTPVPVVVEKKQSIAVLPFVAFSDEPADEFFADGMVEELLNLLAQISDLKVAARTSSFSYKGVSNKTIVEIGRELGVETILEGSIRKNDVTNRVRVTAQLIKVSTGEHLWSETYDKEYRDIFQIQDDIAHAVVGKMKLTLFGNNEQASFVAETSNVDAMVAYGKGKQELGHRTSSSITKALAHFKQAIALDVEYARAYVGVADANMLLALYGTLSNEEANKAANKAIEKALQINNKLGSAYASKGLLLISSDTVAAEQAFKKAIELNPNYAMAYMWYGSLQQKKGQLKAAHQLYIQAFELDPKSPVAAYNVAWGYYQDGAEHKAMDLFSQIIANDPYYPGAYNLVGNILFDRGRLDQSINMFKRALEVDPYNIGAIEGLLNASIDIGDLALTNQWFDYIDKHSGIISPSTLNIIKARFFMSQGDNKNALISLNQVDLKDKSVSYRDFIEGEKSFYMQDYATAKLHYEKLLQSNKDNNAAFYYMFDGQAATHMAYTYQQLGNDEAANSLINGFEAYLQQKSNKAANNPQYYYNMALVKSLQSKTTEAFYYMQGAIDAGWIRVWGADIEPIFTRINQESQYAKMMGGVSARLATMRDKMAADNEFLLADSEGF